MNLAWILFYLPIAVAAVNQLVLRRNPLVPWLATAACGACFVISLLLLGTTETAGFSWAKVGGLDIHIALKLDHLSTGMMVVVTGVGFLVHLFSLAYMKEDESVNRYFCGLGLFMFSMTGIVLSENFVMMFIFWELVGLSSYLLISHWYHKDSAADAGKKAFLCNRLGDFSFMIGVLLLWGVVGTLSFDDMKSGLDAFRQENSEHFIQNSASYSIILSTAVLCIFGGAVGKSAQLPLHVWLPDAMEGPTPASALIHAATMVAAGVYMLFRLQLSIGTEAFAGFAGTTIAWIGGLTALLAALMATQQNDIKRILAYSTLSQLGYMIMAVGLLAGEAGMFHLYTHAWFKALLFLAAGAIIYACHHQQDIWKMGGLLGKMPITTATFAAGTAALIAVPYVTSGFWSKEEILAAAYDGDKFLFAIAAGVAFLTAFYMTRAFVVTFLGKPRSDDASHAHEVKPIMWVPLAVLAVLAIVSGYHFVSDKLNATRPEHVANTTVLIASIGTLVLGVGAGLVLYLGRNKDPLSIPLFRDRFYFDSLYDNFIVRYFQDAFAAIVHFFDELLINGLLVGGLSRGAVSLGNLFRKLQSGQLQAYSFAFGLGVILVIYFTVFL
ncbi:MAG TPA: NADH-quinone oxidoreductase subunit L [Luteolibacter sp.]|nr:NADH-quinone oxidoreductase subunit L [Luteolibacter sp.]